MSSGFKKKEENFNCEICGYFIVGDGYTNHCPLCLWSKHVDNNPGDRESFCLGLMKPVSVEIKGDKSSIIHRCEACGVEKKNKVATNDDYDKIVELSKPS